MAVERIASHTRNLSDVRHSRKAFTPEPRGQVGRLMLDRSFVAEKREAAIQQGDRKMITIYQRQIRTLDRLTQEVKEATKTKIDR